MLMIDHGTLVGGQFSIDMNSINNTDIESEEYSAKLEGHLKDEDFFNVEEGEGTADEIIESKGLKQVSDSGALEKIVVDVLAANAVMVEDFINSDESKRKKKLGGFMGQIMKASKGQANPQQVNQILLQKLNELL